MRGTDTTEKMVYGHEAWICTDKQVYQAGETVCAVLRWGHNMRPDGFCRADEFSSFVTAPDGTKTALIPEQGDGDFYNFKFEAAQSGVYTIASIYDNTYGRDENDEYYEGTREQYPDMMEVINYLQIYSANVVVAAAGEPAQVSGIRLLIVPEKTWDNCFCGKSVKLRLTQDNRPIPLATVLLVAFDGTAYKERILATDREGVVMVAPDCAGTYCLIYRCVLDERVENAYDSRDVVVTYAFSVK